MYQKNLDNWLGLLAFQFVTQKEDDDTVEERIGRFSPEMQANALIQERLQRIQTKRAIQEGAMFRNLEVTMPDGSVRRLSGYIGHGKYVLVDFWASWCQPCLKEIPNIVAAKRKFGDHLEVCAITLDKISTPWKRAINEKKFGNGIHHYQGIDKRGNQYKDIAALGFETIPQNYLLDREGKIIAINIKGNELIKKLEELTNK